MGKILHAFCERISKSVKISRSYGHELGGTFSFQATV